MTRTHIVRLAALGAAMLIGVAACSSDSDKTSLNDLSTVDVSLPDATLPAGVTLPPGVVIPGVSDDCKAIYAQFITALTSLFAPTGQIDYSQVFGGVTAAVPADLQDDMAVVSQAFQAYGAILVANNNDPASAEVQQAIQALSTPEVTAAGTAVQEYFEATCPELT